MLCSTCLGTPTCAGNHLCSLRLLVASPYPAGPVNQCPSLARLSATIGICPGIPCAPGSLKATRSIHWVYAAHLLRLSFCGFFGGWGRGDLVCALFGVPRLRPPLVHSYIGSWEILGKCYNFSVFQFPPCKMGIKRGATWHVTSYYWVGAICGPSLYNHPPWQASPSPIRQVLWLHFSGEKMEACRKASLFVWWPIAVTYPSKSTGTPMPKLVHFLCCKPCAFLHAEEFHGPCPKGFPSRNSTVFSGEAQADSSLSGANKVFPENKLFLLAHWARLLRTPAHLWLLS